MGTLTPYICVADSRAAIRFYADAFGATIAVEPIVMDDGRVGHVELSFDGAHVMMSDRVGSRSAPRSRTGEHRGGAGGRAA